MLSAFFFLNVYSQEPNKKCSRITRASALNLVSVGSWHEGSLSPRTDDVVSPSPSPLRCAASLMSPTWTFMQEISHKAQEGHCTDTIKNKSVHSGKAARPRL